MLASKAHIMGTFSHTQCGRVLYTADNLTNVLMFRNISRHRWKTVVE